MLASILHPAPHANVAGPTLVAYVLLDVFLIVVLAWGVNWSVTKQLVQFLPPLWTSAIRSWIPYGCRFAGNRRPWSAQKTRSGSVGKSGVS